MPPLPPVSSSPPPSTRQSTAPCHLFLPCLHHHHLLQDSQQRHATSSCRVFIATTFYKPFNSAMPPLPVVSPSPPPSTSLQQRRATSSCRVFITSTLFFCFFVVTFFVSVFYRHLLLLPLFRRLSSSITRYVDTSDSSLLLLFFVFVFLIAKHIIVGQLII